MTARPSRLGAVSYEAESSWAEAVTTYGTRLETHGAPVLPSDIQQRVREPIVQQYAEEGKLGVRGVWQGGFTIELALTGHGGTAAGALTETALHTILASHVGSGSVAQVGTTVDAAPTSSSQFALVGGTVEGNKLIRVGVLGDTRGNGQFAVVNNSSTITLLTALDATPDAGDVVYAAQNIYPMESISMAALTSKRFLFQTANGQWSAHGCFPTNIAFSGLNTAEEPRVSLTYGVSRWAEANETFPDATATAAKDGAVVAAGSCFLQDYGTVTRQKFSIRNWDLSINMEVTPLMGPGGVDSYQSIVGAVRTRCGASFSLTADAEASGTNTFNDIYTGTVNQHCLISLSVADGKALGFYFANAVCTNYVTQIESDGINRRTISFDALTDTTGPTEARAASWNLAMG